MVVSQTARGDVSPINSLDDDDEHVAEEYGGIIPAYKDTSEQWRHTSPQTRNAMLLAMGLDPADPFRRPLPTSAS